MSIYLDEKMREAQINDIVERLSKTFKDKTYVELLRSSDKKWLDEDVELVLYGLMKFVKEL